MRRALTGRSQNRHLPYGSFRGVNIVHRNGTLYRIPTCRVARDYNMPIAAKKLQSWLQIDPVDVVVVRGADSICEWFVRAHSSDTDRRFDAAVNKFLVHIPTVVTMNMIERMRGDEFLSKSSLLTEHHPGAENSEIEPLQGGWPAFFTEAHDGAPTTRQRLQQITREACDLVTLMRDKVAYPGHELQTQDPIVDWSKVRAAERALCSLEEAEIHSVNGDDASEEELVLEGLDAEAAASADTDHDAEMSSEEEDEEAAVYAAEYEEMSEDDDDGQYFRSTREHLTNAEQGLKDAMGILDDIVTAPSVSENDYMKMANALKESFSSIKALSKRVEHLENDDGD